MKCKGKQISKKGMITVLFKIFQQSYGRKEIFQRALIADKTFSYKT